MGVKYHVKKQFEEADPWTHLKINNLVPVFAFIGGLIVTTYIYQGKIDVIGQKLDFQQIQINRMSNDVNELYSIAKGQQQVLGEATESGILKKK